MNAVRRALSFINQNECLQFLVVVVVVVVVVEVVGSSIVQSLAPVDSRSKYV